MGELHIRLKNELPSAYGNDHHQPQRAGNPTKADRDAGHSVRDPQQDMADHMCPNLAWGELPELRM